MTIKRSGRPIIAADDGQRKLVDDSIRNDLGMYRLG